MIDYQSEHMDEIRELSPEARKQLASELSGKLAEALKPEREPLKLGLWQIEAELAGLFGSARAGRGGRRTPRDARGY